MKQIIKIVLVAFLASGLSCSDYLDITPSGQKDDEIVWTTQSEVEGFIANMYAGIPETKHYQDDPWIGCSDEADLTWTVYTTYSMNQGNWSEGWDYYNKYGIWYKAIRQTLLLEKNIDRCKEMPEDIRERSKYEAKFLRGYYYWLLIRQYGPAILIQDLHNYDDDFSNYARSPFDECVAYIVKMMEEAEIGLPLSWRATNTQHLGRPDQLTCMAVKSIVLHHAASPQFNGNKEYAGFKNQDGTELISTVYDEQKWKDAAAAALDIIKIAEANPSVLGLYSNANSIDNPAHNAYKSVVDVQLVRWNQEVIFARSRSNGIRGWMIHAAPGPSSLGGVAPTQRLVDAFLMKNGKPIEDSDSEYIEEGWTQTGGEFWNPNNRDITSEAGRTGMILDIRNSQAWGHWTGEWNMYANREPRFYASVLYNKRIIPSLPDSKVRRDYFNTLSQQNGYGRVELYYGGTSRKSGAYTFYPRSGYLSNKFMDPLSEMGNESERKWPRQYSEIYIRYATILLNYIEALNEYNENHPDIQKYWDQIRKRAGVPSVFAASPEIKGNRAQQTEFIIRERLIELNMEGDRYFTTRRRWMAHQTDTKSKPGFEKFGDGGPMYGMDIDAGNPDTNTFANTDFYRRTAFETRVFRKAFYLFPLPKKEIDNSKGKIAQNPWWRN